MPATRGSRFDDLPVYLVTGPDGTSRQVLGLRLNGGAVPGTATHRVTQGETADLIAARQLGDQQLWWRVLDVNPLRYPLDLDAGTVLRLPEPGEATRANRARSF
jgi:hypothetical protein